MAFPLQFAKEPSRADELIVENPASDFQQFADQRIAQCISDGQAFLLGGNDAVIPENGQLLGDGRLVQGQVLLELVHRPAPAHQDLENSDPRWVRQCLEESGLERLKLAA